MRLGGIGPLNQFRSARSLASSASPHALMRGLALQLAGILAVPLLAVSAVHSSAAALRLSTHAGRDKSLVSSARHAAHQASLGEASGTWNSGSSECVTGKGRGWGGEAMNVGEFQAPLIV